MMIASGRQARGAFRGKGIVEAVIDLIRNHRDAGIVGALDQFGERRRRHHRAARIGRRADDDAFERLRPVGRKQRLAGDRPAGLCIGLDEDRLATERGEDVPIGRIARQRNRHPVARRKSGKKRKHEARRRARRHDNACRIDVEIVPIGIGSGNTPAQRTDAERFGIAKRPADQRGFCGSDGRRRRPDGRLTDLHMDDAAALGLEPTGSSHNVHHHERRHFAAGRRSQQAFCLFQHEFAFTSRQLNFA